MRSLAATLMLLATAPADCADYRPRIAAMLSEITMERDAGIRPTPTPPATPEIAVLVTVTRPVRVKVCNGRSCWIETQAESKRVDAAEAAALTKQGWTVQSPKKP